MPVLLRCTHGSLRLCKILPYHPGRLSGHFPDRPDALRTAKVPTRLAMDTHGIARPGGIRGPGPEMSDRGLKQSWMTVN